MGSESVRETKQDEAAPDVDSEAEARDLGAEGEARSNDGAPKSRGAEARDLGAEGEARSSEAAPDVDSEAEARDLGVEGEPRSGDGAPKSRGTEARDLGAEGEARSNDGAPKSRGADVGGSNGSDGSATSVVSSATDSAAPEHSPNETGADGRPVEQPTDQLAAVSEGQDLGEPEQKPEAQPDLKPSINGDRLQRFLIGFLFALSFYLVEAGLAEILLARNAACLESLTQFRLAPDPFEVCMSELGYFAARSVSRGFIGPAAPALITWPVMGIFYAMLGGGLAQFKLRRAIAGFVILQIVMVAVLTSIGYLSQFIV
jgi:hypothetical protein